MKSKKVSSFVFMLFFTTLMNFPDNAEAGLIYQVMTLKDNGSGSVVLNYDSKQEVLKSNNFVLANFPFSEQLAKDYFASPNNKLRTAKLNFRVSDSTYFMTIEVDFKDINKLNQAKGFSNVKTLWTGSDSVQFSYTLLPALGASKFLKCSHTSNFESPIKSSNGSVKDKTVTWGERSAKNKVDFSQDINLVVTTTAKIPVVTKASEPNSVGNSTTDGKEEKSCGLFGFELPLILLAGYTFSITSRRRRC
ncbi:MAG: hypothetical protein IPG99_11610 [Ignavibacteria bacterium]|nr:hypothetical protein [Ignavibacteria bacterium]